MTCDDARRLDEVCAAWGRGQVRSRMPLAATGFSGAAVHVVSLADHPGRFVLKPFATHVSRQRAEWVHHLMRHARAAGVTEVPRLLTAATGGSVVESGDGRLWELVQFVDGQPCPSPTQSQAAAAVDVLARLHASLASLPGAAPDHGPSSGVVRRMGQARDLLGRPWVTRLNAAEGRTRAAGLPREFDEVWREADRILADPPGLRGLTAVAEAAIGDVRRQAVLRDIWGDHVLFDPANRARVAGIIDFHAAGVDTPITDIARLLGSWETRATAAPTRATGLADRWQEPLAAYERASGRSLTAADRWLCGWLHASAVICSLDNWFRWTVEESRHFPDASRVLTRIRRLLAELPAAVEWLSHAAKLSV